MLRGQAIGDKRVRVGGIAQPRVAVPLVLRSRE